jgi:hypothetical protein
MNIEIKIPLLKSSIGKLGTQFLLILIFHHTNISVHYLLIKLRDFFIVWQCLVILLKIDRVIDNELREILIDRKDRVTPDFEIFIQQNLFLEIQTEREIQEWTVELVLEHGITNDLG